MRTIDGHLITETSLWQRLKRNGRLLLRMGQMLFAYFVVGNRIRRVYRAKEARGEVFWVDEELV
jgi:hypothetical protein